MHQLPLLPSVTAAAPLAAAQRCAGVSILLQLLQGYPGRPPTLCPHLHLPVQPDMQRWTTHQTATPSFDLQPLQQQERLIHGD